MNPIDEFHLRILNAHGTISPEYYYIVPDNVYLMMPNTCGVKTMTSDVVTQSIFEAPEDGVRTFRERFMGAKTAEGNSFTVYEPGDIIPIHIFNFSPTLGTRAFLRNAVGTIEFGYVGTFRPGSLHSLPFLDDATPLYTRKDNFYGIVWQPGFEKVTDEYFPKEKYIIQNYCLAIINYLKTLGDAYNDILRPFNTVTRVGLTRSACVDIMKLLLPVIPENSMAPKILASGEYRYSLHDIVEHFSYERSDDKPMIVLFNACRTLKEDGKMEWNGNTVDTVKPSMALVRAMSASVRRNDSDATVNMKLVNTLRIKKGMPIYPYSVIKYDQLSAILHETYAAYNAETDAEFRLLIGKLAPLLEVLAAYRPPATAVEATKYMNTHLPRIYAESNASARRVAEAKEAVEKTKHERELLLLKRRRDKLKMDKLALKKAKKNTTAIDVELDSIVEEIRRLT